MSIDFLFENAPPKYNAPTTIKTIKRVTSAQTAPLAPLLSSAIPALLLNLFFRVQSTSGLGPKAFAHPSIEP